LERKVRAALVSAESKNFVCLQTLSTTLLVIDKNIKKWQTVTKLFSLKTVLFVIIKHTVFQPPNEYF
jgi:hypothetical protein